MNLRPPPMKEGTDIIWHMIASEEEEGHHSHGLVKLVGASDPEQAL